MRAITPFGRGLAVVAILALVALLAGSSSLQIVGAIVLTLAAAGAVAACVNSGQGLARLYDPEWRPRDASSAIADAVGRGQGDGGAQAAAYAEVMRHSTHP